MERKLFIDGAIKIYWLCEKDKPPELVPFIEQEKKSNPQAAAIIKTFFRVFQDNPQAIYKNREKFKKLDNYIFEFKPTGIIRLLFFYDSEDIYISHAAIKKKKQKGKSNEFNNEVERANLRREQWLRSRK